MNPFEFVVIAAACWRTAHLLVYEEAPFRLMARVRERTTLGGLLSCMKCASVWTAALMLALWFTPLQPVVCLFAISGAALMLASYSGVNH